MDAHFYHFFNRVPEVLARALSQEKETKDFQVRNREVKWSLSADYMVICIEMSKNLTKDVGTNKLVKL